MTTEKQNEMLYFDGHGHPSVMTKNFLQYFTVDEQTFPLLAHLFPAVTVIPLKMPFDDRVWRAGLTLQEGAASLHPVLHHLQSVLIGCGAERERCFHGN